MAKNKHDKYGLYEDWMPSKASKPKCYHGHPPLVLPGTGNKIWGGSCLDPAVTDADVYIGFDGGMRRTDRNWPWTPGTEFLFKITDMSPPSNVEDFNQLLDWTGEQLAAGKKVHCGCIGGHGRTGTFLAAMVAIHGEKDAIAYVRKHYCHRAVESQSQIAFLVKHYGVNPVEAVKAYKTPSTPDWTSKYGGLGSRDSLKDRHVYEPFPGSSIRLW